MGGERQSLCSVCGKNLLHLREKVKQKRKRERVMHVCVCMCGCRWGMKKNKRKDAYVVLDSGGYILKNEENVYVCAQVRGIYVFF